MGPIRRTLLTALTTAAALCGLVAPANADAWAPASTAAIHPGVVTDTAGAGQCTSNFIFRRKKDVYIGQAAHCSGTGDAMDTNGCIEKSLPLGTRVDVDGARKPGTLAYNSWLTMQRLGEQDEEACEYNDFALVRLARSDKELVNPSVPVFGGPAGIGEAQPDEKVYTYGNSSLRGGMTELSPKSGTVLDRSPGGWSYTVITNSPGVPGDSGSAFLNAQGQALGVLSTLGIIPFPGTNGVGSITKELAYVRAHAFKKMRLVSGTEPFKPRGG